MRGSAKNRSVESTVGRWDKTLLRLLAIMMIGCVAGAVGGASGAAAQEKTPDASPGEQQIRVITYNVQFLPGLAAAFNERKHTDYRARTIGRLLAEYDIVGLNEVFHHKPRKLLLDQLRAAWGDRFQLIVSPEPDDKRFNGGLAIATRLPMVDSHAMLYSVGSSPKKYGLKADGFAAKGALHARVRPGQNAADDAFFDVFVTHLESKDDEIRVIQYRELSDFIRQHSAPRHAAIVMGDFNTRGNPEYQQDDGSAYHLMLEILSAARPSDRLIDLWPALNTGNGGTSEQLTDDGGRRIDYIFVFQPADAEPRLVPRSCRVRQFRDPKVEALSDHSAVEAVFAWRGAEAAGNAP